MDITVRPPTYRYFKTRSDPLDYVALKIGPTSLLFRRINFFLTRYMEKWKEGTSAGVVRCCAAIAMVVGMRGSRQRVSVTIPR